jgi:protein SCO1/2
LRGFGFTAGLMLALLMMVPAVGAWAAAPVPQVKGATSENKASQTKAPQTKAGVLLDQFGKPVPNTALSGHYLLVYFGYTFCPDICPMSVKLMSDVLDHMGPEKKYLKVFFVTVDPKRDTPDVMRDYLSHFNPQITGLTGSVDDIAATAAKFHVLVQPGPKGTISHGMFIYFLGPDGRLIQSYRAESGMQKILNEVEAAIRNPLAFEKRDLGQ